MIELHQIDTSERNEPWKIWVNPANVLWIAERDGDELGGTDIYFSGTMLMVSERPQAVLQLLGHLVMPEPDYPADISELDKVSACDFGCTCETCTKSRQALNREG